MFAVKLLGATCTIVCGFPLLLCPIRTFALTEDGNDLRCQFGLFRLTKRRRNLTERRLNACADGYRRRAGGWVDGGPADGRAISGVEWQEDGCRTQISPLPGEKWAVSGVSVDTSFPKDDDGRRRMGNDCGK